MSDCIAIVEDEQNIRDNLAFALEREGYRIKTYGDGLEAWEAFQQELPQLVILDIIMPKVVEDHQVRALALDLTLGVGAVDGHQDRVSQRRQGLLHHGGGRGRVFGD